MHETIFRLIEYEIWCNLRAIDFLANLSDAECNREFGFGWRTPHRTVFHIVDVMRGWSGCVGPIITRPVWREYDRHLTLNELRANLVRIGDAWLESARASHERGILDRDRRLHQVLHLVTHGTHHRGQLLSMISLMGYEQPFEGGDFSGWCDLVPSFTR